MKVRISDYYTRIEKMKISQTFKNQFGYRLGDYICLKDFDSVINEFNRKYKDTHNTKYLNAMNNWKTKKKEFVKRINNEV